MSCRVFQRRVEFGFLAALAGRDILPAAVRVAYTERNEPFRQFLGEDAEWQSHPTMRRRILHLHDLFAPEREIVAGKG